MEYSFEKCNIPNRPRRQEYAIFIDAERTHSPRGRQLAIFPVMHLPYSLRRTMLRSYPITHLLPGIFEISQEAIAQQMNERIAMTGIAAQTGING